MNNISFHFGWLVFLFLMRVWIAPIEHTFVLFSSRFECIRYPILNLNAMIRANVFAVQLNFSLSANSSSIFFLYEIDMHLVSHRGNHSTPRNIESSKQYYYYLFRSRKFKETDGQMTASPNTAPRTASKCWMSKWKSLALSIAHIAHIACVDWRPNNSNEQQQQCKRVNSQIRH